MSTACTGCGFNPASVSPSDAVVALRSFGRRYRSLVASVDADERERLLSVGQPSALDLMREAADALGGPVATGGAQSVAEAVGAAAETKASEAERRSGDEWKDQRLLDELRGAVHTGVHHLRLAEKAVEAALRDR
jgi:hypothetical protein